MYTTKYIFRQHWKIWRKNFLSSEHLEVVTVHIFMYILWKNSSLIPYILLLSPSLLFLYLFLHELPIYYVGIMRIMWELLIYVHVCLYRFLLKKNEIFMLYILCEPSPLLHNSAPGLNIIFPFHFCNSFRWKIISSY